MAKPTQNPDIRRKKLRFRSWRRGTREMDLLLGQFADDRIQTMSEDELDAFAVVLRRGDQDLYEWVTGKRPWPADLDNALTLRLTRFAQRRTDR